MLSLNFVSGFLCCNSGILNAIEVLYYGTVLYGNKKGNVCLATGTLDVSAKMACVPFTSHLF